MIIIESEKEYSVYKLTSPEGKVYIGCTGEDPKIRWSKGYVHNPELTNDIKNAGLNNFKREVVSSGMNEEDAYNLEKELIHKYDSTNPDCGYNKSTGGRYNYGHSFKHTEEAIEKIRKSSTGRYHTEETKHRMSENRLGEKNPMYGKHPSEETLRKLSDIRRGQKRSEETKQKIGEAHRKKVMCIETGMIYESMNKAAEDNRCHQSAITKSCKGNVYTAGGYHWKYVN